MRRPPMLLRCSEALAQLLDAAFTRRALRPGNVACGDRCVRGTLTPRHHAGTNDLLSKALGATGRKAAFAPRHYRNPAPGDTPRKTTSAASGRRPVVTGRCASTRPPDERHHGAEHRLVGAAHLHVGPAGARRPHDAPAALDGHPPQPRGRLTAAPAGRSWRRPRPGRQHRRQRPARRGAMCGRDADEPAPHVLRTNGIAAAGSVGAAGRPPSREPIAMSAGRASRADGRKRLAGSRAADGVPEGGVATAPYRRHHGANDMDSQTIEKAIKRCIDISTRLGALEDEVPPRTRARHCPVRGRNRRNAAMARRPRVKTPAAGPEAASAACHRPFRDKRPRPPSTAP